MKTHCRDCIDKSCAVSVLSEEELEKLSGHSSEVAINKGEILYKQGSLITSVVYLKKGLFKEYYTGVDHNIHIVQIVKQHAYLGLSCMFGDKFNHYSYAAIEDSVVCYIDASVLKDIIIGNGKFAYEILTSVCTENLNNYNRCANKNQKQIFGRLAETLLFFSNNIYNAPAFSLPVSQSELASLIGTTRESVTRMMSKLNSEGIIEYHSKEVKILNTSLLTELSQKG
jgi:CRP-like cAMP-binding protein